MNFIFFSLFKILSTAQTNLYSFTLYPGKYVFQSQNIKQISYFDKSNDIKKITNNQLMFSISGIPQTFYALLNDDYQELIFNIDYLNEDNLKFTKENSTQNISTILSKVSTRSNRNLIKIIHINEENLNQTKSTINFSNIEENSSFDEDTDNVFFITISSSKFNPPKSFITQIISRNYFKRKEKLFIKELYQCPPNCEQCHNKRSCDKCMPKHHFNSTLKKCISTHSNKTNLFSYINCALTNVYKAPDGNCYFCDSICRTCSGSARYCTSCLNGLFEAIGGVCYCRDGYYLDGQDCLDCGNCRTCDDQDHCTSCGQHMTLVKSGSSTICQCNDGYIMQNGKCTKCHSDCLTCNGIENYNCLTCPDDKVLYNNKCITCDPSCKTCYGPGRDKCSSCNKGYAYSKGYCKLITKTFTPSRKFTPSKVFTPSRKFTPSKVFTPSRKFTRSRFFTPSSKFTASDFFTPSSKFTTSGVFTPSSKFTASDVFTFSSKFTSSDVFTPSKKFTASDVFTFSNKFTASGVFTSSSKFTASDFFTFSSKFTASGVFTSSKEFTKSDAFSLSQRFTKSVYFSLSQEFTKSDIFSPSEKFTKSDCFSQSQKFTNSDVLTKLQEFTKLDIYSISKSFTKYQTFQQTRDSSVSSIYHEGEYSHPQIIYGGTKYFTANAPLDETEDSPNFPPVFQQQPRSTSQKKSETKLPIIIGGVVAVLAILIVVLITVMIKKRMKNGEKAQDIICDNENDKTGTENPISIQRTSIKSTMINESDNDLDFWL